MRGSNTVEKDTVIFKETYKLAESIQRLVPLLLLSFAETNA